MEKLRLEYPVWLICKVLKVSSSGFYAWRTRPAREEPAAMCRLRLAVQAAHTRMKCTFGSARLHKLLCKEGHAVSLWQVKKLRRELGLSCIQGKKRKCRTTDSNHALPVAPNLLERNFMAPCANQVWVSDITYIPTEEGWVYLAGIKDIYSKQIVGYSMSATMDTSLVAYALKRAVAVHNPPAGLILHSDQGSQYCSHRYRQLADFFELELSMSRKGDCYDNAPMESFWGILKNELVHHARYATRAEAVSDINDYIEVFYNRQRLQKGLDYLSPAEFMRVLQKRKSCHKAA
jgi:putative transposase